MDGVAVEFGFVPVDDILKPLILKPLILKPLLYIPPPSFNPLLIISKGTNPVLHAPP
jgi:hypothetical protein